MPVPLPVPEEPVPVLPEPVLPEPMLPALGTEPEEEPGALGEVVVVPDDVPPDMPPEVPPLAAPEPCSFTQSSRCVPVRPTHWLGVVDAPAAADPVAEPLVLVSLGRLEPEPVALEPDAALPVEDAPVEPETPVEPEAPVPVASVAVESARSAAAVAAVMVFNIMS